MPVLRPRTTSRMQAVQALHGRQEISERGPAKEKCVRERAPCRAPALHAMPRAARHTARLPPACAERAAQKTQKSAEMASAAALAAPPPPVDQGATGWRRLDKLWIGIARDGRGHHDSDGVYDFAIPLADFAGQVPWGTAAGRRKPRGASPPSPPLPACAAARQHELAACGQVRPRAAWEWPGSEVWPGREGGREREGEREGGSGWRRKGVGGGTAPEGGAWRAQAPHGQPRRTASRAARRSARNPALRCPGCAAQRITAPWSTHRRADSLS